MYSFTLVILVFELRCQILFPDERHVLSDGSQLKDERIGFITCNKHARTDMIPVREKDTFKQCKWKLEQQLQV